MIKETGFAEKSVYFQKLHGIIAHVKYLGLHLDRRLTWHTHILAKRNQLGLALNKMYWLLGRNSKLSTNNKLLIYKIILKPIWTYGIQLWGTTATSNIDVLERLQSKFLRLIVAGGRNRCVPCIAGKPSFTARKARTVACS
jgi:hypothetical protein